MKGMWGKEGQARKKYYRNKISVWSAYACQIWNWRTLGLHSLCNLMCGCEIIFMSVCMLRTVNLHGQGCPSVILNNTSSQIWTVRMASYAQLLPSQVMSWFYIRCVKKILHCRRKTHTLRILQVSQQSWHLCAFLVSGSMNRCKRREVKGEKDTERRRGEGSVGKN